jgi:hypothetical protein
MRFSDTIANIPVFLHLNERVTFKVILFSSFTLDPEIAATVGNI